MPSQPSQAKPGYMKGCSLVDTRPAQQRKEATHFLSWVWRYSLSTVCSSTERWVRTYKLDPKEVFFFVCFFCNNQHRLLVERTANGSDNLEEVFEARLLRIKKVVALLDTWDSPMYTTRVWCIFEQYEVCRLGIDMHFAMQPEPAASLIQSP